MKEVRVGKYRHYSGKEYQVIVSHSSHSETLEPFVVYQALYGDHRVWNRPRKMFMGEVEIEGKLVPRFVLIEEYK